MAYSCVKVLFEIGHEASIRTKRTPEGFTHDWEVFVRGADNSDIFHFVEKVVFHLHETFPKPKRVVKESPYSVKESGYAGFNLPIDIYFKNSDEPKRVRFDYDLQLQNTGPPISKVRREQFVFPNPAEDLRRRLIKGGGVGVLGSESGFHLTSSEKLPPPTSDEGPGHKHPVQALVGKPKLSGNDSGKKHKVKEGKSDESRVSNSFHDLFGPPIKTAKVSPDPKKSSSSHSSPKVSPVSKSTKPLDKSSSDKAEKSSKSSKHGSQREGKEATERSSSSSSSTKEEKKEKDKNRDKEKNKDKAPKRPSTPVKPQSTPPKRPSTPPKRPVSPPKRPPSPAKHLAPPPPSKLSTSPKHASSAKPNKDEPKKSSTEDKNRSESKSGESNKSEKKKKDKKNRDEKPKKDKHKDHEKGNEKIVKSEKSKDSKDKDANKKLDKETIKEPEKIREKEKDKSKHGDGDKEKQRHKHKKKDKSNKDRDRDKEREKDKSSKKSSESKVTDIRDKDKNGLANESSRGSADTSDISAPHKKQAASSPSPSPVRVATSPMKPSPTPEKSVSGVPVKDKIKRPLVSDDSSDSHSSALSEDEVEPPVSRIKPAKTPESGLVPVENKTCVLPVTEPPRPNSRSEVLKPKSENSSQERNSLNKSNSKQKEKSSKKNKEKESGSGDGEKPEKDSKKNKKKRSSRIVEDVDCSRNNGEAPLKIPKLEVESEELPLESEQLEEKAAVEDMEIKDESESEEPPPPTTSHLTEEYVSQLRELQHKIMTLEDNAELQRVVQVIAETGQYEITKKTFDFDLCALDRSTVERLQEFFAPS